MRQIDPSHCRLSCIHLALAFTVAAILLPLCATAADRNHLVPAPSAYVYAGSFTQSNLGAVDYVNAFSVNPDGSLQPVSGSPFNLPSFGLVAGADHVFGNDQKNIASYSVGANGALQETSVVNGLAYIQDPGDQYVSAMNLDRTGQTLNTVDTCGSCNSEVLTWSVGSNGELSYLVAPAPLAGPAKTLGVMTFSPDDHFAYELIAQDFGIWRRNDNGTLTWINPGFVYAPPLGGLNQQVCLINSVAASGQGYVTLAWYGGGPGCNAGGYVLGNYTVASNGALNLAAGSGITPQVQESSMAYDPSGVYLALGGNGVQVLKLQTNERLEPVTSAVQSPNGTIQQILWDNVGHVYCTTYSGLDIYNFDGQHLTLAPGSPHPITNLTGMAVIPAS